MIRAFLLSRVGSKLRRLMLTCRPSDDINTNDAY